MMENQEGKPLVLNVVRKAEQKLINDRYGMVFDLASFLYHCG